MGAARYRLGVDIGGTFTDATLVDESSGRLWNAKVSSTPHDPAQGFLSATRQILDQSALAPDSLRYVVHATTVATNAIIEGKVAPTVLITTEGFRDILEIARQIRPSLYDTQFEKPKTPRTTRSLLRRARAPGRYRRRSHTIGRSRHTPKSQPSYGMRV